MKRTELFSKAFTVVMMLAAAILFAASLAGYIGNYRYLEVFGDFRPYYFGLGIAGGVSATALLRFNTWKRACVAAVAMCAVTVGLNGIEVLPWLLAHPAKAEAGPDRVSLKAIAFNVEANNTNFAGTRDFVEREAPDVAMFCESAGRWPEELLPLEQKLPHHVRIDAMDIEVFSRHSVVHTQEFHFGPNRGFVAIELNVDGQTVTFVAVHTPPRHWFGAEGFRQRTLALAEGLGRQSRPLRRPLIVMGDFNASPWSPAYKNMIRNSGLQEGRRGFGILPTHHEHGRIMSRLWRPIDHCLHSSDVEVRRMWTGPDLNSDHLPVLVEVVVPRVAPKP